MNRLLFILLMCFGMEVSAQTAAEWIEKAYAETDRPKKIEYFSKAIAKDPGSGEAYVSRAGIYFVQGKYQECINDCKEVIRLHPNIHSGYGLKGVAELRLQQYDEAIKNLSTALALKADYHLWRESRGYAYYKSLKYENAIADAGKAIELDPSESLLSYEARAVSTFSLGRFEEAIKDCDRALNIRPDYLIALIVRANAKHNVGRYEGAIKDFESYLALDSVNAYMINSLAWTKVFLGKNEEAIVHTDKALKYENDVGSFYDTKGLALFGLRRYDEAISAYNTALRLDSKLADTHARLGLAYIRTNKYAEAVSQADQAIELQGNRCYALLVRGLAQFKLGKTLDAQRDLIRSKELVPGLKYYHERQECEALQQELSTLITSAGLSTTTLPKASNNKKVALVIGVKNYQAVPALFNSLNDANDIASMLKRKGFEVITLLDPKTKAEIRNGAIKFAKSLENDPDGIGLLYYSGHGLQVDGSNYLIPASATLEIKADVQEQCLDLDYFLRVMEVNGNHLNIVILDACRNNPFRSFTRATDKGLSMVSAPKGSYIVYSTKPGAVASDGTGRNGLFTSKLLKYLDEPELNIEQVFKKVAAEVSSDSNDSQRPWIASDYTGDFYFTPFKE